jgi:hypothetical protein
LPQRNIGNTIVLGIISFSILFCQLWLYLMIFLNDNMISCDNFMDNVSNIKGSIVIVFVMIVCTVLNDIRPKLLNIYSASKIHWFKKVFTWLALVVTLTIGYTAIGMLGKFENT